jgi:hypothetical protein
VKQKLISISLALSMLSYGTMLEAWASKTALNNCVIQDLRHQFSNQLLSIGQK